MDTENKENLTTIHHVFNASDISIDSLNPVDSDMNITKEIKGEHDHSPEENSYVGPALVEASSLNLMELSQSNTAEKVADTVETASALASSLINDSLLISLDASLNSQPVHKETEKYANDLACELINDTNQIVRSIHSHEDKYSEDKTNVQETAVNNEVKEEPDDTGDIEGYSRSDGPSADRRSNQSAADAANVDVDAAEAIAAEPEPASAPVMTIDEQQIEQDREPKLEREPEPEPEIEQQQQPAPESELQEKAPQLELAPEPKIVAESTSELQEQQKPRSLESLQPQPQDTQQNEQRQQRALTDQTQAERVDKSDEEDEIDTGAYVKTEKEEVGSSKAGEEEKIEEAEGDKLKQDSEHFSAEPQSSGIEPATEIATEEDEEEEDALEGQDTRETSIKQSTDTSCQAQNKSFQSDTGDSLLLDSFKTTHNMEFTKNYSDDLLMGQNEGQTGGADLADFELPPCSGSSSGDEPKQSSPSERKSSSSTATQASSSHQVSASPPDLAAVKNLILSSYSKVSHVFHWEKPIETGIIFSIGVTLIIALTFFSIISVVAYTALGIILTSGLIRIYKASMKTLNKSQETPFDHIWDKVLSINVSVSPEKIHQLVDTSHSNINASLVYFKQVLLVQDKLATFKFATFLYLLTYIGSWFNGLTIITICYIALFFVPKLYEKNKTEIDNYVNLATSQVSSIISFVTSKVSSIAFGSSSTSSGAKKHN